MNDELKAAILGLVLPCDTSHQDQFLNWFEGAIAGLAETDDERSTWLRTQLNHWLVTGAPSSAFKGLVQRAIFSPDRQPYTFLFGQLEAGDARIEASRKLASRYFEVHRGLMDQHLMTFDEARQFVSYSAYLIALAVDHRMSASEISRALGGRDPRYARQWRPIKYLLDRCRAAPDISPEGFEAIYNDHAAAEQDLLCDLRLEDAIEFAGRTGATLGFHSALAGELRILLLEQVHEPYIYILHYQLMCLFFCDHAVTYAYEFSPRGRKADFLTGRYNASSVPVARNAFLNNAKATLRFDQTWVDGRAEKRRAAASLAAILGGLEAMSPLSKRELARSVLAVLHRYLRISLEKTDGTIPHQLQPLDASALKTLLESLSASGSNTNGIIEQRVVDCYGSLQHDSQDWASRGLGDSVFAASVFRNKLGDVEFVNVKATPPELVGYESHGGHLTEIYVKDHFDTFFQVLEKRALEFENVAPLAEWRFRVVFVAHTFEHNLETEVARETSHGEVQVAVEYRRFADIAEGAETFLGQLDQINGLLIAPLNEHHVHPKVRQRLTALSA